MLDDVIAWVEDPKLVMVSMVWGTIVLIAAWFFLLRPIYRRFKSWWAKRRKHRINIYRNESGSSTYYFVESEVDSPVIYVDKVKLGPECYDVDPSSDFGDGHFQAVDKKDLDALKARVEATEDIEYTTRLVQHMNKLLAAEAEFTGLDAKTENAVTASECIAWPVTLQSSGFCIKLGKPPDEDPPAGSPVPYSTPRR